MTSKPKRAVFFDFGDTLASTDPPYLTRIAMALRRVGYDISDRDFEIAYVKADYEIYKRHIELGGVTPEELREWFFPLVYKNLSITDDIETAKAKVRAAMRDIRYGRFALPGAVDLLENLKNRGFILGVISNNDGRTNEKCEEVGIGKYLDIIVDSTNLGLVKPDFRIFRYVLNRLNIEASQAIHIGDLFGSDVMGGLNAGLDVLWMNTRQIEKLDNTNVNEVKNLNEIKKKLEANKFF